MRALWERFGRDFYAGSAHGTGVAEAEVEALFDEITGLKLKRFFDRYVRGTDDLPLDKLLAPFGVTYADNRKDAKPVLGIRTTREGNDCKIANVYEGGVAHQAGLSAGDVLIALDGLRVSATSLDTLLSRYRQGDSVVLHAFRRDELMTFTATLAQDDAPQVTLSAEAKPAALVRKRGNWLSAC